MIRFLLKHNCVCMCVCPCPWSNDCAVCREWNTGGNQSSLHIKGLAIRDTGQGLPNERGYRCVRWCVWECVVFGWVRVYTNLGTYLQQKLTLFIYNILSQLFEEKVPVTKPGHHRTTQHSCECIRVKYMFLYMQTKSETHTLCCQAPLAGLNMPLSVAWRGQRCQGFVCHARSAPTIP